MDELTWLVPKAATAWILEWGLFTGGVLLLLGLVILGLRKFFLWRRGTTEILIYLKRLTELQEKSLLELELLNRILRTPLKKSQAPAVEPVREVSQREKENLLAALKAAKDQTGR